MRSPPKPKPIGKNVYYGVNNSAILVKNGYGSVVPLQNQVPVVAARDLKVPLPKDGAPEPETPQRINTPPEQHGGTRKTYSGHSVERRSSRKKLHGNPKLNIQRSQQASEGTPTAASATSPHKKSSTTSETTAPPRSNCTVSQPLYESEKEE